SRMEIVMGQVIPWPSPENRPARPLREADGQGGQILLFLGVRYERHREDGDAPLAPSRPGLARSERTPRRRKRG
ncbi:MAG: hypothetical protein NTZ14_17715, partial [Hyphomicrobiales bacterium]|nr:hypothetical protein [Hyphomicrobiales bacterium]